MFMFLVSFLPQESLSKILLGNAFIKRKRKLIFTSRSIIIWNVSESISKKEFEHFSFGKKMEISINGEVKSTNQEQVIIKLTNTMPSEREGIETEKES